MPKEMFVDVYEKNGMHTERLIHNPVQQLIKARPIVVGKHLTHNVEECDRMMEFYANIIEDIVTGNFDDTMLYRNGFGNPKEYKEKLINNYKDSITAYWYTKFNLTFSLN